jgi:cystathionine gamma-lyase
MKLCDIKELSKMARERGVLVVVDNTFMSPYFQRPLTLGADIVIHSTTKFINGHSDSVGGAIMLSDDEIYERLKFNQNSMGAILSPFDSYMTLRGIKTLALRMREHERNAMRMAEFLEGHPRVKRVLYPGLKSHPQHELAKKQMSGFGGMLSFEIDGGYREAKRLVESTKIFLLAESLGGVESLIELPGPMTHSSLPKEERDRLGIGDNLVRMSVGVEHIDDLIDDIDQALKKAFQ